MKLNKEFKECKEKCMKQTGDVKDLCVQRCRGAYYEKKNWRKQEGKDIKFK